ncbi:hypothetical protein MTP99_012878 [Tenebrio molitor]|nr:hypothetical protein MTP99_012878 [Tenebrio molitor]CAH1371398.1 unnamed protein product [Tenebrio molitor]
MNNVAPVVPQVPTKATFSVVIKNVASDVTSPKMSLSTSRTSTSKRPGDRLQEDEQTNLPTLSVSARMTRTHPPMLHVPRLKCFEFVRLHKLANSAEISALQ